ncbi:hypothetical protein LTR08_007315 [Meristemomyces frigidus]|nr:hypothetical protein LTR08_007315 [Meristemomyces frigidus]
MGPHEQRDEEAVLGASLDGHDESYHDETDDDATIGPDAPLNSSSRPSSSFDGLELAGLSDPSWHHPITKHTPPGLKHAWQATLTWVRGPDPPRIYTIHPFLPNIQHAPIRLLDHYAPKQIHRFWLLLLLYATWILSFALVLRASSRSAAIPGHGTPIHLNCGARYWSEGNGCGLNGDRCRPFTNATLAFRCPAGCLSTQILNPHAVGDQEVVYQPLVIGGPPSANNPNNNYNDNNNNNINNNNNSTISAVPGDEIENNAIYRGDSFICAAAIHAGFLSDAAGGCGVLALTGTHSSFASSTHHGITSTPFASHFPQTFAFLHGTRGTCQDLRWPSLALTVTFTAVLALFTTSPGVFFWSTFIALFFQTALASDPPSLTTYPSLLSLALGRFLPASFCAWVTYRYTVRRSLHNLTAQLEKTVLWLGPAWVGALNNLTFDKLPLQRLTPHDLHAQPGAIPALIAVVLTIFLIALGQTWAFRVEGRMPRYLALYSILVSALLLMLALPGLNLRIHHYILALVLLPGTSFQNRPSLLYQGLLVGLFINGIARWGFDSILQTPGELLQGATRGTLLPSITVLALGTRNITFDLGALPRWDAKARSLYDGISILVNDVERFRGYAGQEGQDSWLRSHSAGEGGQRVGNYTWTWNRHPAVPTGSELVTTALPEYFRFGYMAGSEIGDFSRAGKWTSEGGWVGMEPGPS